MPIDEHAIAVRAELRFQMLQHLRIGLHMAHIEQRHLRASLGAGLPGGRGALGRQAGEPRRTARVGGAL